MLKVVIYKLPCDVCEVPTVREELRVAYDTSKARRRGLRVRTSQCLVCDSCWEAAPSNMKAIVRL